MPRSMIRQPGIIGVSRIAWSEVPVITVFSYTAQVSPKKKRLFTGIAEF